MGYHPQGHAANVGVILLILMAALLVQAVPSRPFSIANWGYHPSGGLTAGLGVILVLAGGLILFSL